MGVTDYIGVGLVLALFSLILLVLWGIYSDGKQQEADDEQA